MNNLTTVLSAETKTMSSLEIAELTGKDHKDVLRDIRVVLAEIGLGESRFASSYLSKQNKELPCYNLPREECDLVITGYSAKYRYIIIKRWHELEQAVAKLPEETKVAIGLSRESILVPAWERERDLYIAKIEADHAISMYDIAQRRAALEQREYVLVDGMAVKADMAASKAALPVITITEVMQGTKYTASEANLALYKLGLLERSNTRQQHWMLTAKGSFYGRNVASSKSAKTVVARWFEGETTAIQKMVMEYYA